MFGAKVGKWLGTAFRMTIFRMNQKKRQVALTCLNICVILVYFSKTDSATTPRPT